MHTSVLMVLNVTAYIILQIQLHNTVKGICDMNNRTHRNNPLNLKYKSACQYHNLLFRLKVYHVRDVFVIQQTDVVKNTTCQHNAWNFFSVLHFDILKLSESPLKQPECHFNNDSGTRMTVIEVTLRCGQMTIVTVRRQQPVETWIGAVTHKSLVSIKQLGGIICSLQTQRRLAQYSGIMK